jgi:diguanylate cyclase (GGDEF)-like protein/PAS domain S-box-containing protein
MIKEQTMESDISSACGSIFQSSPDGILLSDETLVIRAFNPAMEALTGWKAKEVVGKKSCLMLFQCRMGSGEEICPTTCPGLAVMKKEGSVDYREVVFQTKDGREISVACSHKGLKSKRGEDYVLCILKDITHKKAEERALKKAAITDGLTGLYNFRYFKSQLDLEVKRAERYLHPVSLVMVDIDHFKSYNDHHGHLRGNNVLERIASLLKTYTRETNLVARFGGEEFMILLPETESKIAAKAAVRMRRMIQKERFPLQDDQPSGNLTVSLGVASFPWDAPSAEELVRCADAALYRAKALGRNRVYWYGISRSISRYPLLRASGNI